MATSGDVEEAIDAARKAFGSWSNSPPESRYDLLKRCSEGIFKTKELLANTLTAEIGKPLRESRAEVARAARIFYFHAAEALRTAGRSLRSVRPGIRVATDLEPLGVIGVITPWNFPIAIPAWKIAPALAAGCTVVFKPSIDARLTSFLLVTIVAEAGLPAGVLNLVAGKGQEIGSTIVSHPRVSGVTFTRSLETGQRIASQTTLQ